jgi:hypothetical protein
MPEAVLESRKPMRKTFPVCCAAANEQSARSNAPRPNARTTIFVFISFLCFFFLSLRERIEVRVLHCSETALTLSLSQREREKMWNPTPPLSFSSVEGEKKYLNSPMRTLASLW